MTKRTCLIIHVILLFVLPSRAQLQDGSVLERRVSIQQNKQTLGSILDQISWQAGVYFSYDAACVDADSILSVEVENKSLYNVLNLMLGKGEFNFSELENQVIITKIDQQITQEPTKPDTIPKKYFFLSGKILESKKENPLKYATISVLGKPIGTISNQDGDFLLKVHPENITDTVIISCMGYKQLILPAYTILDEDVFIMHPVSIKIKEVKVTATTPHELLNNIRKNVEQNYSGHAKLMTAFYRETVKQNSSYINVSEAVLEVLKASYSSLSKNDVVRLIKGRKSPDVQPFKWVNFKLQGGPFTIIRLDVIKMVERFIDAQYEELYKYTISEVVWYNKHPVYVVKFEALPGMPFPAFEGEMYVHRETFAVVHATFQLNKSSLREAQSKMITKKPRGVKARPSYVNYTISYQQYQGKWHLATAQASVKVKIRSKRDKLNSEFHSVSDLLITNIEATELKRFKRDESFSIRDVFVEMISNYDQEYWENYNIIKPDDDLRKAFIKAGEN